MNTKILRGILVLLTANLVLAGCSKAKFKSRETKPAAAPVDTYRPGSGPNVVPLRPPGGNNLPTVRPEPVMPPPQVPNQSTGEIVIITPDPEPIRPTKPPKEVIPQPEPVKPAVTCTYGGKKYSVGTVIRLSCPAGSNGTGERLRCGNDGIFVSISAPQCQRPEPPAPKKNYYCANLGQGESVALTVPKDGGRIDKHIIRCNDALTDKYLRSKHMDFVKEGYKQDVFQLGEEKHYEAAPWAGTIDVTVVTCNTVRKQGGPGNCRETNDIVPAPPKEVAPPIVQEPLPEPVKGGVCSSPENYPRLSESQKQGLVDGYNRVCSMDPKKNGLGGLDHRFMGFSYYFLPITGGKKFATVPYYIHHVWSDKDQRFIPDPSRKQHILLVCGEVDKKHASSIADRNGWGSYIDYVTLQPGESKQMQMDNSTFDGKKMKYTLTVTCGCPGQTGADFSGQLPGVACQMY